MSTIALRVDVDTHEGMRDGVPRLLEIFHQLGVRASFFFSMGPDHAGRAIFNLLKPGFLSKMVRTGAPGLYGFRTVLSGTLLPARPIGIAFGDLITQCSSEGHEIGVHCWDHRLWQDRLDLLDPARVRLELDRGLRAFSDIAGPPVAFAAPAWLTRDEALLHQDTFGLRYASDCRGVEPFLPVVEETVLATPQVPANMATLDEVLGRPGQSAERFFAESLERSESLECPVFTLHAEAEGGRYAEPFRAFLRAGLERTIAFAALGELLREDRPADRLPACRVARGQVPGRHGVLSVQGASVSAGGPVGAGSREWAECR